MMSPASAALNRVLTGTSTPPAVSSPNAAMIHSAEFGAQIATRSPLSMPTRRESAGGTTDPVDELGEAQPQRTVDDRFGVTEAVRRTQDHLGDGLPLACPSSSHRHESGEVAAHDLRLIGLAQVLQRVDVVAGSASPSGCG